MTATVIGAVLTLVGMAMVVCVALNIEQNANRKADRQFWFALGGMGLLVLALLAAGVVLLVLA